MTILEEVGINILILVILSPFIKKLIEKYIDNKINIQLESHKNELKKDLENFKEKLYSSKPLKDEFIEKNKELITRIGDIRSLLQQLLRAHLERQNIKEAWGKYFSNIPEFEDFIVRYKSPYFKQFNDEILDLSDALNDITREIESAKNAGQSTYNVDIQKTVDIMDKLKDKIYKTLVHAQ